ncbi:hypothetical protein Bhyg_06002, partial [Pseudolycoriella hygida]
MANTKSFTHLLKSLRPTEKDYIASCIVKKEWNLGSAIVLEILQHSGILTMSEFMALKIETENVQEVHLIFNDLLEVRQLSLLVDLLESIDRTDPRSQLLTQCVNDGFKRFLEDLSTGGYSCERNYLLEIKSLVMDEQMERIRILNLNLLLEIEDCTLGEAVSRLNEWLNETSGNCGFNDLVKELLYDQEKIVEYLHVYFVRPTKSVSVTIRSGTEINSATCDTRSAKTILLSLLSYENNIEVLDMYAKTSISPATNCNDLVLSFKQMCRSKIERLKLDLSGDRLTVDKIVLVDDDDDMEF